MREREVGGHRPRSPGERHAGAPVTVIVNDRFRIEAVSPENESGRAMRAKANRCPNDAIRGDEDGCEVDARSSRRSGARTCACDAPTQAETGKREAAGAEQSPPIHARSLPRSAVGYRLSAVGCRLSAVGSRRLEAVGSRRSERGHPSPVPYLTPVTCPLPDT